MFKAVIAAIGALAAALIGWKLKSGSDAMNQVKMEKADNERADDDLRVSLSKEQAVALYRYLADV